MLTRVTATGGSARRTSTGLHELVQRRPPADLEVARPERRRCGADLDVFAGLLDRQSFAAVLEREILRARLAQPSALRCS